MKLVGKLYSPAESGSREKRSFEAPEPPSFIYRLRKEVVTSKVQTLEACLEDRYVMDTRKLCITVQLAFLLFADSC